MDDNERKVLAFPLEPGFVPSNLPFFVVGIGASAGGITALLRFLEAVPADNGMAYVIVLHLSPEHESNMAGILQTKTRMPVLQVTEALPIEANHVYVIPPTKDMVMHDGRLQVLAAARSRGRHTAIDIFLRTLAEAHRERAVGIARIKEKGGMTFVQTPEDAEYDSMPLSAIATGMVDIILPVVEMPQKLIDLSRNAAAIQLPAAVNLDHGIVAAAPLVVDDHRERALRDIMSILQLRTGHDFSNYKRETVLRRLERRLQVNGLPDVMAYRAHLEQNAEETPALLQDMLSSVTNFFRDRDAFEALERDVIPRIFRESNPAEPIRVWSMGCATGEEAYSIAMLLSEQNALIDPPRAIQVFASDIDERALNIGRRGMYPESIITDVSPTRLRQHFERQDDHYCVRKEVRDKVLFAVHNALRDPPFSRIHLISCRNLMIYLDRDIQRKVFEMMHYALHGDGFLFLGNAESADGVPDLFVTIDKKHRIYQATKSRSGKYYVPIQPPSPIVNVQPAYEARLPAARAERPIQQLYGQVLQEAAPPSVLIDQDRNLVYAAKSASRFLQPPQGEVSQSILALAHPDLQLELRAALFQATKTGLPVKTEPIAVRQDDQIRAVRMIIRPAPRQHAAEGMTLLLFQESAESADVAASTSHGAENAIALHLEDELRNTKEQLRAVIDQYETTMADLKASNEELQAVNEELRSAMEELETSQEELQSVKEELLTVNVELKTRVD
jgi:two-component system CheB/CheR fusion protein